jgi:hypothetical protein
MARCQETLWMKPDFDRWSAPGREALNPFGDGMVNA